MGSTIRQHSGALVVAAATIIAGFAQGLFQPGAYAAGALIIWALLIVGLIGGVLPVASVGRLVIAAGVCLLGTAVLETLSITWAADQGRAFDEAVRVWFYLGLFLLAACTASASARREWIAGLTLGLTVLSVAGVFSYLQPGILDSGRSEVPNAASRLSYPIGYWNGIASMFAATAVLLAYMGDRAPSRRLRTTAVAAIPLVGLGIWLASSRGGVAAALIGWAVLIAAAPNRGRQAAAIGVGSAGALVLILLSEQMDALTSGMLDSARRTDGDWMTALLVAVTALTAVAARWADGRTPKLRVSRRAAVRAAWVAAAILLVALVAADPAERFREFKAAPPADAPAPVGATGANSNGRWQFWGGALDAFGEHPIAGPGAGGFENWWARNATIPRFVRNPHSLPLQQAAELGIAGFMLFAGFVVVLGIGAERRLRAGREGNADRAGRQGDAGVLVAVLVTVAVGAAVDWTWEIPVVFGPALICAALLVSAAPPRLLSGGGRRLGIATVVIGWIAISIAGIAALTEWELARARDAASGGRIRAAIDDARAASSLEPWSAKPYAELAVLESDRQRPRRALGYLELARERDSDDWRLYVIEWEVRLRAGDTVGARGALRRARALSPFFHRGNVVELG
jgi:hypothetical protein